MNLPTQHFLSWRKCRLRRALAAVLPMSAVVPLSAVLLLAASLSLHAQSSSPVSTAPATAAPAPALTPTLTPTLTPALTPTTSQTPAQRALARLATQSAAYQANVPNFSCEEAVVSELVAKDRILQYAKFTAAVRVQREAGGQLTESFEITRYNDAPPGEAGSMSPPIYIRGGLSQGLPSYFAADQQHCYDYTFTGTTIAFHAHDFKSNSNAATGCDSARSTHGEATLDADGNLLEGERSIDRKEATAMSLATTGRLEYAPVTLGGQTYRIPSHFHAEFDDKKSQRVFDAAYTGCRLFHSSAAIVPGSETSVSDSPRP
jgi:hypothetical protein